MQTAALLMRANERVFMGFGQNTEEVMIDALSQSQETALLLGTELENTGNADLVPLLEMYCEDLYVISQNLHSKKQMAKLYKKIKKELKLYYSISEVAKMFDVNESLLRYWEKEFPMISPKKTGGNVRQYRKEDIENIRLVYHLVKEKGMTLAGAKQRLRQNREGTMQTANVVERLKCIREELVSMRNELDYLT